MQRARATSTDLTTPTAPRRQRRRTRRALLSAGLVAGALLGPSGGVLAGVVPLGVDVAAAESVVEAPDTAAMEQEFVDRINALRVFLGGRPLEIHPVLVAKARGWAAHLAAVGRIGHSRLPDGITVRWRVLGENVGAGRDVERLFEAFVKSPSHLRNLMDPRFTHVGIGVTVNEAGRLFVAQEFMLPR